MSASTVIGDITETLRQLLQSQQQPQGLFTVSLASPADVTINALQPQMNVYLFRLVENAYAKNQVRQAVGRDTLAKPPLALNLYYVLTPFAADQIDEHRVLGETMRIFYDHAIVAAPLLRGDLELSTEEFKIDLCPFTLEELTRIWHAVNRPYRLSICYEVRIILVDSSIEQPSQRVTEQEHRYFQLSRR
jgi:hypothetical protein